MRNIGEENVNKEGQQTLLTTLDLSRKIVRTILSFSFTLILVDYPMVLVISILAVLSIMEIFVSIKLYRLIFKSKKEEK